MVNENRMMIELSLLSKKIKEESLMTYRIYRIFGNEVKHATAVMEIGNLEAARNHCENLNKHSTRKERCFFKINPEICIHCAKKGFSIYISETDKFCPQCGIENIFEENFLSALPGSEKASEGL